MIKAGKIVNTHGVKGELRIIDGARFKCHSFPETKFIFIDGEKYEITSRRNHKQFIMIKLKGFDNINDVIKFKNKYIEVESHDSMEDDPVFYLDKEVYLKDKVVGKVETLMETPIYYILVLDSGLKIPLTENFIEYKNNKLILRKEL